MRISVIIIIIILRCTHGSAQYYFNNTYNNAAFHAELSSHINVLPDGTFLIPTVSTIEGEGYFYNWRVIGADGIEISTISLLDTTGQFYAGAGDNFVETLDNNFVQSHIAGQAGLMKFDPDGLLQWQIEVDSLEGGTSDILQLVDGSIFFTGKSYGGNSCNLFRNSSDGLLYQHTFILPFENAHYLWLEQSLEFESSSILHGGFAIYWPGDGSSDADGVMIKSDSLGNLLWAKHWDDDLNDQFGFFCRGDNDTTVVVTTKQVEWYQDNIYHDPFTARMGTMLLNTNSGDTSGVILIDVVFGNPYVNEILRTPDSGYIMMGWANDDIHTFTFLMKLDANRQLEWYKKYAPEPPEIDPNFTLMSYDIEITADSSFVVCGEALDWGNNGPNKQMPWIFKTDQCGELEWNNCGADFIFERHPEFDSGFLQIFPNPATDMVHLKCNNEFESITIYDMMGREVMTTHLPYQNKEWSLDVSKLNRGCYVLQIADGDTHYLTQRFVKE